MATVVRSKRILAGKMLMVAFHHLNSMRTVLWLEELNALGLTPKEKVQLAEIQVRLNNIANEVRAMGWKIRRESV